MHKLYVNYDDREEAKKDGAFFDNNLKTWLCDEDNKKCIKKYDRIYLKVDYDKKDYVKSLGGRWDMVDKKWYCSKYHKILIDEFKV